MTPTDAPTQFQIARVELKTTLEPRNPGDPAPVVVKLGLLAPDGEKIWPVDFYCHGGAEKIPQEGDKDTFIVGPGKYGGLEAKRPKSGGGGGFRGGGRSPADTKAIQRQHSQEMALRYTAQVGTFSGLDDSHFAGDPRKMPPDFLTAIIDWFEKDIAS